MSFKLAPAQPSLPFDQTVNQETASRFLFSAFTLTSTSGQLRLAYFRPNRTGVYTSLAAATTGTPAAATPTLCRMGVWIVNNDGSLTLIGSIPNDTSLFASANTEYQRTMTAPITIQAGKIYAFGVLVVTAVAAPSLAAIALPSWTTPFSPQPALIVTGQADLPANIPGNNAFVSVVPYGVLIP